MYDVSSLVTNKESLTDLRTNALTSGDWSLVDEFLVEVIKQSNLPPDAFPLLPDVNIAHMIGAEVVGCFLLPDNVVFAVLTLRPKKGLARSLAWYEQCKVSVGDHATLLSDHDQIAEAIENLYFAKTGKIQV